MPNLDDMVARAEADLREAQAASASADARAQAAQADAIAAAQRAKEMQAVLDWLRSRSAGPQAPTGQVGQAQNRPTMRFGRPVSDNPITELCLRVLEDFGRPATTKQIRERLDRDGHEFTQAQVRTAMRYMAAKKTNPPVETTSGTGLWRLRSTRQVPPFRPEAVTGLPAANGAGGRP